MSYFNRACKRYLLFSHTPVLFKVELILIKMYLRLAKSNVRNMEQASWFQCDQTLQRAEGQSVDRRILLLTSRKRVVNSIAIIYTQKESSFYLISCWGRANLRSRGREYSIPEEVYLQFLMKIYSPPDNHILSKILFTARISNTAIQHEVVPYGHKNKQFQEHHALFTAPALEVQPGIYVFGVHAILRLLAPKAHFLTPFQEAEVNQWFELIEKQLQPAVGVLILNNNQLTQVKAEQIARAKEVVAKVAKTLDERLKVNTFLMGDSLSIADISAFFSWKQISSCLEKQAKNLTNLHRWTAHISSIPK